MALPPGWPMVTVSGTYLRIDGTPSVGSVWFETAQPCVIQDAAGIVIGVLPRRQVATLDSTGTFSISLPCTDAGGSPTGWTYQVSEKWDAGQPTYSIEVPQSMVAEGINLPSYPHATPVPVNPPVVTYLRTSDIGTLVASQTDMAAAIATANNASTQAAAAVTTANAATVTANNASATANAIAGTANTALTNANAAVTTANAAEATANGIAGTANTALANANAAVTTANNAQTDATNAVNTANGIAGTANTALANANAAVTTANNASTTAGNAVTTANAAQATANAALPATSNAVSASKWQTARTISLTGPVTGSANVDGSANAAIATTLTAHSINGNKIDATGSTNGQVLTSAGAGNDATWSWAPEDWTNLFINGECDVWQRATSYAAFSSSLKYCCDRFYATSNGTTIAPSQQSFAVGQTAVPANPNFFQRYVTVSTANAGYYAIFGQRIENVARFSGQACTLSFWAKADAARPIGIEILASFGSTGSAALTGMQTTSVNLTTGWVLYTYTFNVPSFAGKTIAGGNDCLDVVFWLDCGSNFTARGTIGQQSGTFDFAEFKLQYGNVATPMVRRPFVATYAMCQRYYEKSYEYSAFPGSTTDTTNVVLYYFSGPGSFTYSTGLNVHFLVPKRAAPTFVMYSTLTGASGVFRDVQNNFDVTASAAAGTKTAQAALSAHAAANVMNIQFHWTADAEL